MIRIGSFIKENDAEKLPSGKLKGKKVSKEISAKNCWIDYWKLIKNETIFVLKFLRILVFSLGSTTKILRSKEIDQKVVIILQ